MQHILTIEIILMMAEIYQNVLAINFDWVLSHWVHFTVHSLFCAFVFHTAYMLCYCQHSGVDLVGLKPSP